MTFKDSQMVIDFYIKSQKFDIKTIQILSARL